METAASALIDALGGTTAVARLTEAPISTVHSWRKKGIPQSRLAHLRLAVRAARSAIDFDKLAVGTTPPQRIRTALCSACDRRAEDPAVTSCTAVSCPMQAREAA